MGKQKQIKKKVKLHSVKDQKHTGSGTQLNNTNKGHSPGVGDLTKYDHKFIERYWQKIWEKQGLYEASDNSKNPKFYVLVEFPYPSGAGLHVGHVRSWAAMDAYARRKRMQGYNVLYPIGWDAFGLPAENYAIKTGIHPSITVKKNIETFKNQCKLLGLSFDWSREIDTTDPNYYKWSQWIFIQMFKNGLAYRNEVDVNWCPFCKTNLADEEVLSDGKHERCGQLTEKRKQNQWLLRITEYADRLLSDLKDLDFSPRIRIQQENWIGKKEGAALKFQIPNYKFQIEVFTTRPDTLYGATFMVVSPEYANKFLIDLISNKNKDEVNKYIKKHQLSVSNMSNQSNVSNSDYVMREKTGIDTGLTVINPATGKEIPVWVSDYVLSGYGTGAIMAVPAHDERDWDFATKFNLPIIEVIKGGDVLKAFYDGEGEIVNSGSWNGLKYPQDYSKILFDIEEKGWGKRGVEYHIHDWIFSRQHYWGEPIPMIFCKKCASEGKSYFTEKLKNLKTKKQKSFKIGNLKLEIGNSSDWKSEGWFPVPEEELPVELPFMEKYQPSGTGESPLATNIQFLKTKCPNCGGEAKRETDTMPNWAGSNWYYLGYLVSNSLKTQNSKTKKQNRDIFTGNKDVINYWMPVDIYQGGFEHTTLHLLYSRFIYKFLFDIGVVPSPEPYLKRRSHGIVLGSDSRKMSKSFGNVISPDTIVEKFGADTLRLYEMFMGPFDQAIAWNDESVEGCYRFLGRIWRMFCENVSDKPSNQQLLTKLHQTIKKVDEDFEDMKFNTAISSLMEFSNDWNSTGDLNLEDAKVFCRVLAPFAPHMAEEAYQQLIAGNPKSKIPNSKKKKLIGNWKLEIGNYHSIHLQPWPSYDPKLIIEDTITIAVQVNGKLRSTIELKIEDSKLKEKVIQLAKEDERIKGWLEGKEIKNEIYVPGRLINFVL